MLQHRSLSRDDFFAPPYSQLSNHSFSKLRALNSFQINRLTFFTKCWDTKPLKKFNEYAWICRSFVWELSHQFISKQIAFWLLIANMQINLFDGYHKNLNKQIPHPFTDQLRVGEGWAGQAVVVWVKPAANECFVVWKKWRHC